MNKVLLILTTLFITAGSLAQVPEKMSYQAVVRNGKNTLVANQPIGLRISIIQGAVNGTEVYQEIFHPNPVTNANGLVTAEIGSGTTTLGIFSSIDWANGPYFIKAETDTTGGTNYTITGTTRLLSVPYALHAKTAESYSGTIIETDPAFAAWDKDYDDIINKPDLSIYATKNMANQNITNLADPVNAQDVATKAYVDALLKRLEKLETDKLLAGGFVDARDGIHYKAVKIGHQVWMAENLKYLPDVALVYDLSNTEPQYFVNYDENNPENYFPTNAIEAKEIASYNTYGVLYNWPAAMNGASPSTSNPSLVQGVCPAGWHLPSHAEWVQLIDFLGGENVAGGKLKQTGTTHWKTPNTGATNESGFTALPGGDANLGWGLTGVSTHSIWWSSSWNNINPNDYFPGLEYSSNMVHWGKYNWCCNVQDYKSFGFSVRCVKD